MKLVFYTTLILNLSVNCRWPRSFPAISIRTVSSGMFDSVTAKVALLIYCLIYFTAMLDIASHYSLLIDFQFVIFDALCYVAEYIIIS